MSTRPPARSRDQGRHLAIRNGPSQRRGGSVTAHASEAAALLQALKYVQRPALPYPGGPSALSSSWAVSRDALEDSLQL